MKKIGLIILVVLLNVSLTVGQNEMIPDKKKHFDEKYLNLRLTFPINPVGLGYKHQIHRNLFATGNIEYFESTKDLEFRLGVEYRFPMRIIIFKFYTGTGLQLSRNDGYQYPFISIGTRFIFLFSEVIIPMQKGFDPKYRLGFSFRF